MDTIEQIKKIAKNQMKNNDPGHDFSHVLRVLENSKKICNAEIVDQKLVLCAVLLHDLVVMPKSYKKSKTSSTKSAKEARKILSKFPFSDKEIKIIYDAIVDHSFSKNKTPKTLEGKILQDADRLDAIGSIGIARAFSVGGEEKRQIYETDDPFCFNRRPNDKKWTLDHFYKKLLLLEKKMYTKYAKREAKRRTKILKFFLKELSTEI